MMNLMKLTASRQRGLILSYSTGAQATPTAFITRLLGLLIPALIAVAAFDNVNFSGAKSGFALTPFLVLSPFVAVLIVLQVLTGPKRLAYHSWVPRLFAPLLIFFVAASASAIIPVGDSYNLSLQRLMFLFYIVTVAVMVAVSSKEKGLGYLITASRLFLLLSLVLTVLQLIFFYDLFELPKSIFKYIDFTLSTVAGFPRIEGPISDPNRFSTLLVMMLALISIPSLKAHKNLLGRGYTLLAVVLIVMALSRTSLIAMALLIPAQISATRHVYRRWAAALALVVTLVLLATFAPDLNSLNEVYSSSGERVGSTATHFTLIEKGFSLVTENLRSFVIGKGWGTEYMYTREFFGDSEYGNFHSGFVSVFVQSGVFAFIAYIVLLLSPLYHGRAYLPAVLVFIWSNIFYQYNSDPMYWILLTMLVIGMTPPSEAQRGKPRKKSRWHLPTIRLRRRRSYR